MVNLSDRQRTREELVSIGYSWDYIDEWQPKTTLYRHAPGLNVDGNEVSPVGSSIEGVPGSPDYVLKKARIGMFPSPPSDTCTCRWCTGRKMEKQKAEEVAEEYRCDEQDCNFFAVSESHSGKLSSLRMHKRSAHK